MSGVVAGRLEASDIEGNFQDLHPALNAHEAVVAADRCYFCHDAPCVTACPTSIDIPMFIRQISTGNPLGSAETIFDQNILGGMCARVCPTETLCEQVCVREVAEGKPVKIGLLQRYATDHAMDSGADIYSRAPATGKKVAVVGAGPAGLACAHRLAMYGHDVVVFESRDKPGGLNEFGIAAYKTVDGFAQREVDFVLSLGGIDIRYGQTLGDGLSLQQLQSDHDAVFLGMGLAGVNALQMQGADADGVVDAVDFIAGLRQSVDKSDIAVGRRIVVIGGGMTAIDAAVQAKLLGAEDVTICYRRGKDQMNASVFEQDLATSRGVIIRHWLQPEKVNTTDAKVKSVTLEYTSQTAGKLSGTGETMTIEADQVLVAIGQTLATSGLGSPVKLDGGRIATDPDGRTSADKVWAGGDCTNSGDDLTVTAVAQGRDAAEAITDTLKH
ncbi:MAG: NAD(P)-dependent oxidoreductase [Anderseniella sp.]